MKNNTCIVPISYWGNIQYFSKVIAYPNVVLELHENYPKKTYRNRCELYGVNGKLSLQVPVEKGSFHKVNLNDLKISYQMAWNKNHIKTIQSAYKSSPYYEYYEDDLMPLYEKEFTFLKDLNLHILEICQEWLSIESVFLHSQEFIPETDFNDYRNLIHPKKDISEDANFISNPYIQGFEQRHGFIANLSILDLVFNLGPESYGFIKSSYNPISSSVL